jgi:hypothetical protein
MQWIRDTVRFWPLNLDPGWKKIQVRDQESGMHIPDLIFENLVQVFWAKNTQFFSCDSEILSTLNHGWEKVGSGINISDPQQ